MHVSHNNSFYRYFNTRWKKSTIKRTHKYAIRNTLSLPYRLKKSKFVKELTIFLNWTHFLDFNVNKAAVLVNYEPQKFKKLFKNLLSYFQVGLKFKLWVSITMYRVKTFPWRIDDSLKRQSGYVMNHDVLQLVILCWKSISYRLEIEEITTIYVTVQGDIIVKNECLFTEAL